MQRRSRDEDRIVRRDVLGRERERAIVGGAHQIDRAAGPHLLQRRAIGFAGTLAGIGAAFLPVGRRAAFGDQKCELGDESIPRIFAAHPNWGRVNAVQP
jgi:hypothetical protein